MKLLEIIFVIQYMIMKRMIGLLLDDIDKPNWSEIKKDQVNILNDYVISVLRNNKYSLEFAIEYLAKDADIRIKDFMQQEFNVEPEQLADKRIDDAVAFINAFIINSLPTNKTQGTVERAFLEIVNRVEQANSSQVSDRKNDIESFILATLQNGLNSGYIADNGYEWKLDRLATDISSHIYKETYLDAQELIDDELVKVYQFPEPREACKKLEASGIIAIKPRTEIKEENQKYPNIWDSEHKYLEPDGHHGYNCRHAWHNVNSVVDRTNDLYEPVDEIRNYLHYQRQQYTTQLEQLF